MLAPLKLQSNDGSSWVEIRPHNDESGGYTSCEVEAVVDLGHGRFQGLNRDVFFFGIEKFCDEFDRFILDRTLTPNLEGTYDSFLSFSGKGNRIFFSFCVGDSGTKEDHRLSSSFTIEGDRLNELHSYFRDFANAFST